MISKVAAVAPRSRRRALHRQHRRLQRHVEDDRRVDGHLPLVSAHRRRDRRQGLHPRAPVGRPGGAGRRDRARRLRVPGAEVLGGEPRLRPALAVERRARSRRRDDRRDQDGRRPGLPQLHGRRHRQDARSTRSAATSTTRSTNATIVAGGKVRRQHGLLHPPDARRDDRPGLSSCCCEEIFGPVVTAYVYDDAKWEETLELVDATSPYALTGAVFAQDRRAIVRGDVGAAPRGRQLLHQRQADRRGRRPAAVRRRARVGHERQGRVEAESGPLGQRADDQGELQPAARLPLPVHVRRVRATAVTATAPAPTAPRRPRRRARSGQHARAR